MGRKKKYFTEEERKSAIINYVKKYNDSPIGRAHHLINSYNQDDKKRRKCKGDLTAEWVVENILPKPCAHCGKTGWNVIGCNRIDNTKPHTMDNVEPCCEDCNKELAGIEKRKTVFQYDKKTMELVAVWPSIAECSKNGYAQQHICACCNGKRKTHKGYIWSYKPL